VDGRLILQHNQKAWDLWHKDAAGNLAKADANWPGLVARNGTPAAALINVDESGLALEGYDPTAYFLDGKPRKGSPEISRTYQGATYRFVDNDHKNAFEREPARFVPKFGGFCGYAASINKISPVNPEIWQLVDGHLVLQHTPKAFELFNKDVAGNNARAEANWPGLSHRRCN
jgi:YHS domain-containing protein